jgi:hypothetical protein
MKKLLLLIAFLLFTISLTFAQSSSRSKRDADMAYNGKVYDSYGKPLDKKKQSKKKVKKDEVFEGDMKKKAYPIGMDKEKRKKKSNYKGKKRKKGCNCPGK